jgi:hypothetical protein
MQQSLNSSKKSLQDFPPAFHCLKQPIDSLYITLVYFNYPHPIIHALKRGDNPTPQLQQSLDSLRKQKNTPKKFLLAFQILKQKHRNFRYPETVRTSTHAATASPTLVATILAQILQEVPQFVPVLDAKTLQPRGRDGRSVCGAQRPIVKVMRERTSDERQQSGELHSSPSVFSACGGGRSYGPRTVKIRIVYHLTITVCMYLERVALDTGPNSAHVFLIIFPT